MIILLVMCVTSLDTKVMLVLIVLEVLESMDIKSEFPEDVMAEANAVSDAPSEKDMVGRVDLRNEITFTIDGADAKDLDDAVHIKLLSNGNFELGVHIADVHTMSQKALRLIVKLLLVGHQFM